MRFLYTALLYLFLPFIFLRLLWRSRKIPGYRKRWHERLGFFPPVKSDCIWVHAVSVGETIAAIPLIKSLQKNYPTLPVVVTGMTPTGGERVKAAFGDSVIYGFLPYDLPIFLNQFFKRITPKLLIVMETELWPNLFAACLKRHIPVMVANARLSEKSAKGYGHPWLKSVMTEMFSAIHTLAAQADYDADRFVALGLPRSKVVVTGNLKFDIEIPQELFAKQDELKRRLGADRPVWIAASTHAGEEEIILTAHQMIRQKIPEALLMLVPRHPDRFDAVAKLLQERSFKFVRRSQNTACTPDTAVYLADSMGELLLMYSAADVAFVAGSLAKVGGHNMLEPAALHKAILSGPVLYNFTEISQLLLQANAMRVVHNANEMAEQVIRLLQDPAYRRTLGENAYQVVAANRGSLAMQLRLIQQMVSV